MRRRRAFTLPEILVAIVIVAIIAGLTLTALRGGRRSIENLKIAQFVRGGTNRCADLKIIRMPDSIYYVTWRGNTNQQQSTFLTLNENGDFTHLPMPWPAIPAR